MDHYSDKFEEGSFIPSLVEIDPVVFEKKIKCHQCIFTFLHYLAFENGMSLGSDELKNICTLKLEQ